MIQLTSQQKEKAMKMLCRLMMLPRLFVVPPRSALLLSHRRIGFAVTTSGTTTKRLFGSKPGGLVGGDIRIEDDQSALSNIDLDRLKETIAKIRTEINYETYDVNLILLEDEDMQEANLESRGVNEPTDILSFPFHEAVSPGVLEPPTFDVPDYYSLGDMLIDVPYVIRSCQDDQKDATAQNGQKKNADADEQPDDSDDEEEEPDRGVSLAMSKTFDPEQRLHQLLVHGMLHLVGYDHEEDDEYLAMVEREEEILKKLGL
jgi:probable rRNA maturation factor